MNRIDRLQAILTVLQSKRVVRAEDLATRFDVSIRTIYRDIRALEVGGVPIGAEAGVGYFIMDGYHLPPVMFTDQEARALLLGGKIVEQFTDKSVAANFNDALTKVRAVLSLDKRDELETLDKDIIVNPFPIGKPNEGSEELQIDQIKSALASSKVMSIEYISGGKGEHTTRELEPVGLCYYYGGWHLIAFCKLRQDYRDFRLDRISKLNVKAQSYARHKHPSLKEYLDQLIQNTELDLCIIRVHKSIHKYLEGQKYQMGLVKEVVMGDQIEMHFATFGYEYFAKWMLMMGNQVDVVEPNILLEKVQTFVNELSSKYQ